MLNDSGTRLLWGQKTRFPVLHLWVSKNAAQVVNNGKFLASGSSLLAYAKELMVLVQISAERGSRHK